MARSQRLLILLALIGSLVVNDAGADPAHRRVELLMVEGLKTLTGPMQEDERLRRAADFLHRHFDMPGLGRFALGRRWGEANPDQRTRFSILFHAALARTVAASAAAMEGTLFNIQLGSRPTPSRRENVVASVIDLPSGPSVDVLWYLPAGPPFDSTEATPRVSDIVFEGISARVMLRNAIDGLAGNRDTTALLQTMESLSLTLR